MNILFITQWFQPEPMFKGLPLAKALKLKGHKVEVLTGFPNYPHGKLYPGYKIKLVKEEIIDEIKVIRTALYPSHDLSKIKRIVNYLSWSLSASILGSINVTRPDVIYVYHPPITAMIPAVCIKLVYNSQVILDIEDFWPDTLQATDMINNNHIIKLIGNICRFFYRMADKIIVLSPGFKKKLVELGLNSKKIEIIYNWCDEDSILSKDKYNKSAIPWDLTKFTVLYAGNVGRAQALDAVLYAAKIIRDKCLNIQFVFVGAGVEADRLKKKAEKMNLDNVMFIPYKPASEIKRYMLAADALLVHLKDDPLFSITIPSKIQTYLAVGRPIIAGVRGDAAGLIKESGAGVIVPPENPEELAKGIIKIANLRLEDRERIGKNGSVYYENNLSFDIAVNKFERVFVSAVQDKS